MKQYEKNDAQYFSLQNMFYVLKETAKGQGLFLPLLFFYALSMSCSEFIPAIVNSLIIAKLENNLSIKQLLLLILALFFFLLIINGIALFTKSQLDWRFFFARTKFIRKILGTLMNMDYEKLEQPQVLDAQQKALARTSGSNSGVQGLLEITIKNIVNIVKILIALSLVVNKNWGILIVIVLLTFLHFFIVDKTKNKDKKDTWDVLAAKWRRLGYLDNMTSNFLYGKEIRLFQIQKWLLKKQKNENEEAHTLICKSQNLWFKTSSINQIIAIVQKLILYAWLTYSVIQHDISIAVYILYVQVIPTFSNTLSSLLDDVAETRKLSAEVTDYRYFVSLEQQIELKEEACQFAVSDVIKERIEFTFEDVSFRYASQEEYALKDLNIVIKPGMRLAIVGLNGAGKSTFIKLLMRLYEPTEGRILLNGIDIREFDKNDYFNIFAPVFQSIELYAFSMVENITMQKYEASDKERVKECLDKAGLGKKVSDLPNGIDTQLLKVIYDNGVELSGGEKQKLALARALYKDASVIVLDEPTAALDAYAECELYNAFDNLVGNRTAIYISHRLASTRFCDQIAVFEKGKLIEYGTHEELIKQGKAYFELFQMQAKYYQEGGEAAYE